MVLVGFRGGSLGSILCWYLVWLDRIVSGQKQWQDSRACHVGEGTF